MKKQDFKKNFPDVCVYELEFPQILSRKALPKWSNFLIPAYWPTKMTAARPRSL